MERLSQAERDKRYEDSRELRESFQGDENTPSQVVISFYKRKLFAFFGDHHGELITTVYPLLDQYLADCHRKQTGKHNVWKPVVEFSQSRLGDVIIIKLNDFEIARFQ
jgi:hypothetical protein